MTEREFRSLVGQDIIIDYPFEKLKGCIIFSSDIGLMIRLDKEEAPD